MTYPALPDRRIPYDNDGTVVVLGSTFDGPKYYPSGSDLIATNGISPAVLSGSWNPTGITGGSGCLWFFFPEQREISAHWVWFLSGAHGPQTVTAVKGSNDTTNGMDGTWETASFTAAVYTDAFQWRSGIKTISFTGPKKVVRFEFSWFDYQVVPIALHLYGTKAAGQTPDDVIYLDQATSYAEFTAPIDFGDMPLGTTATHQFKVKNASATHTANTINIQCNDADFAISSDGVTWVNTINIASLAAGASSGVLYVRDTTPNPGGRLGPRFARIVTTVASYT